MDHEFDKDLLFLMHDVARLIRVEADKQARVHGMTRAQWALMLRLERNPGLSQKELADLLEVEPISVARLVDRMESSGLIERRPDAQDRRIWRLHLLPAATALLENIYHLRQGLRNLLMAGVPADTEAHMVEGLRRMKINLLGAPNSNENQAAPAQTIRETA